jgi:hypothetical protein
MLQYIVMEYYSTTREYSVVLGVVLAERTSRAQYGEVSSYFIQAPIPLEFNDFLSLVKIAK